MESIAVNNLSFGYTEHKVIDKLNFTVAKGELIIIVGENGSGKSTLLKLILGELKPQSGSVRLMGKKLEELNNFQEIGYVPQMNVVNKIPFPITCLELVTLNLYNDFGLIKIPKREHRKKGREILHRMGLDEYINIPFNELSGGLQQRVMIARAMINNPKIMILDEPTSGVDEESKDNFIDLIQELNYEYNITVILVTHEIDWVKERLELDHIYRIEDGGLKDVGI